MNSKRKWILGFAFLLSLPWRLIPSRIRLFLFTGQFIVESRGDPKKGLARLFRLQDKLDWILNERAMAYEGGIHPKHRLINYHEFFIAKIPTGATVLDVGCGYGAVARSIAERLPACRVIGVDRDEGRLQQAREKKELPNLNFIQADVCLNLPKNTYDVIVLSNILEHISDRVGFLRRLLKSVNPSLVLVRVPSFERDWKMPMRKELGLNYFSDAEHFIEHRLDELQTELAEAGLRPTVTHTLWGEIWMCCERIESDGQ